MGRPVAAGAGAILDAGFPDRGWWVLAPVGVTLMLLALLGRGPWSGLLIGMVAGLSFWLIQINWLTLYLGPVPWLALAGLQSVFFGVSLALVAVVLRVGPRVLPGRPGRLAVVPVVVAGLWTDPVSAHGAREALTAVWPYGGFSRLRAIEAGRTVVNISTVGSSAIITPDGRTLDSLPSWKPGAMVQTVPLSDTVTPAMRVGRGIEWLVSGLGLAGLTLCLLGTIRRRSGTIHYHRWFQQIPPWGIQ